jgi:hypothetical protein
MKKDDIDKINDKENQQQGGEPGYLTVKLLHALAIRRIDLYQQTMQDKGSE